MTHPHVVMATVGLVAVGVILAQQGTQQSASPPRSFSLHGPVSVHSGGQQSTGESGPIADSIAHLATDLAKLATDHEGLSTDEVQRRRDSIHTKLDDLKEALSASIRSEVHEAMATGRQANAGRGHRGSVADLIDRVRHDPEAIAIPAADSFVVGGLQVPSGAHHAGTAATVNGDLDVYGSVDGNAVAIAGDVVLHPGSHVSGSAFAAGGQVRMDGAGGTVDGEIRSLQGPLGPPMMAGHPVAVSTRHSRMHDFKVAAGMFTLLMLLGLAVLTFAEDKLDLVTTTLVDRFGRSAWYGIVGEVAVLPVFLLMVVGLAITIIGILALPFATIGYFVLLAGAATLGLVAVAEATGTAVLRTRGQAALTPRGAQLRAVIVGLSLYGGLWILTAIVGAGSAIGITIRGIAVVVTLVATTVGFGAVIVWRVDLRRARRRSLASPATTADQAVWLTPTPVSGVVAARRPTPPASSTSGSST